MGARISEEEDPRASPIRRPDRSVRSHDAIWPVTGEFLESRIPFLTTVEFVKKKVSKGAYFLLSYLSSQTYPKGSVRLKMETLSRSVGESARNARRQVAELVAGGYVTVERLDSTTFVYRLTEKSLARAPKRPERVKFEIGVCKCCDKPNLKLNSDGIALKCLRAARKKRELAEVAFQHPEWSDDQKLLELGLEKMRRSYQQPLRELAHERYDEPADGLKMA